MVVKRSKKLMVHILAIAPLAHNLAALHNLGNFGS